MTEEKTVGGKPIEEYRDRVSEGNDWWVQYCAEKNRKMYRHHLFPYAKAAIGCQLFPNRKIGDSNNPRRYVSTSNPRRHVSTSSEETEEE